MSRGPNRRAVRALGALAVVAVEPQLLPLGTAYGPWLLVPFAAAYLIAGDGP